MYYTCNKQSQDQEELDFGAFMDFAYDVSERSAPFIEECGLYEDESCLPLVDQANKEWKQLRYMLGKKGNSYDINHTTDEKRKKSLYETMILRFLKFVAIGE